MLKAVIFDFDGVIADTEKLHFEAFNEVLLPYNIEISEEDYYQEYLGFSDVDCFGAISRRYTLDWSEDDIEELIDQKAEAFESLVAAGASIIDGVTPFIEMLREAGIHLAICSGATHRDIQAVLVGADFGDSFEFVIAADDVVAGKPDPEGYDLARKQLSQLAGENLRPQDCIVIEDSHWGLEAGRAAGMKTLAVANSYAENELAAYADRTVPSLKSVSLAFLREMCP